MGKISAVIGTVLEIKRDMDEKHVGAYAAQSAYFIILSFLPLIILLLSAIQYTGIEKAELYGMIESFIPLGFQSWVMSLIDEMYSRAIAAISLSALMTAWSAGKSFMALNRGMNSICGRKNRSYLFMRARGTLFSLLFVVLVLASLLMVVFGNSIHELVLLYLPFIAAFTSQILSFRLVLMFGAFTLFFAVIYRVLPGREPGERRHFMEQLPGAMFASVVCYLFSFFFSIYIEYSNAASMYGSLTTLILFMMWLYFIMYIVLIGMEVNQWLLQRMKVV
ncbi:MAG: YihY/virulence factor BrkB family protein [Lachnospiraceae bacterium]|nr:YihY/virulence factor BrkB family protein [Lachnospiraceae bacterium]